MLPTQHVVPSRDPHRTVRRVAFWLRWLNLAVIPLIALMLALPDGVNWLVVLPLQLLLLVGLARALSLRLAWLWGIGACLPVAGLFVLLSLSRKATWQLRQAGLTVGFLGAKVPD